MIIKILQRISVTFSFAFAITALVAAVVSNVHVTPAKAANFQMQTGYYMGNGGTQSITGLGFQPDFVIVKSDTTAGTAVFKTSAMPSANTAFFSATADNTGSNFTLNSDGFTVGTLANLNNLNIRYTWSAFAGSDCTASGTFCVGTYTGNGAATRNINTGFDPNAVIVKRSTAVAAHFHTSSSPTNRSHFFTTTADNTTGTYIQDIIAGGFRVASGADNVNGGVYYYVAFKNTPGIFLYGAFTGTGADNQNVTGPDFRPDMLILKNSTSGTTADRDPVMSTRESYGDQAVSLGQNTAVTVNLIQELQSGGFQIGNGNRANQSGATIYAMVFGGAPSPTTSGTFLMESGSYTGNGSSLAVSGLPFAPDLVMVKSVTAQYGVFRTSLMHGDSTAYLGVNTADFTGGITSLTPSGFTLGNNATVNSNGVTYHWQAFGNAYNPRTNSGATDFAIGTYSGNAIDDRNISELPWQPNFVVTKGAGASLAVLRTSQQVGDLSAPLNNTAEAANRVQALNSDGFQIGTDAQVNTNANVYRWFAFKDGINFNVGGYTGNNTDNRDITGIAYQPDLVWVKRSTNVQGVQRSSTIFTDSTQYFSNLANVADRIQTLIANGFQVGGNQAETNANGGIYRYTVWNGKRYTQQAYRVFANTNSTNVGSPLAAQNTSATLTGAGDPFRLRLLMRVDGGNLFANGRQFKLQFAEKVGTCDVNFSGETYADVTGSSLISYYNNASPADGASLTPNANDPTDGVRSIVNQTYEEANNFTNPTMIKGTYEGLTYAGQTGKWDFSLRDNGAPADTSYCFRAVETDGTPLHGYTVIPEITTANVSNSITFGLSANAAGFGTLDSTQTRWATDDFVGYDSEINAHKISASTNSAGGYVITVRGKTLSYGSATIDAIGGVAAALTPGTEQFGMRVTASGGNGTPLSPYNHATDYAYGASESVADEIAADPDGDDVATLYGISYAANIAPDTAAGEYETTLTYIITAGF